MIRLLKGDCRDVLPTLESGSVQCCITSPPYYGLRDYGTATWDGGEDGCEHKPDTHSAFAAASTLRGGTQHQENCGSRRGYEQACGKCGARRIDRQIGLEATPEAYVADLVAVFREVRRVLRDDGTLFLNLGDSYAASTKGSGGHNPKQDSNAGSWMDDRSWRIPAGLKPKDLIGIPWMVAFALRGDGWWLRQDIIWSKANPMPESVRDRCTKAHEYVFMLSKQSRYYFDAEAIAELAINAGKDVVLRSKSLSRGQATGANVRPSGNALADSVTAGETRNKRSVWHITSQPFAEAHFATMPPALVEPMILAGCPLGGTIIDPFGGAGTTGLVADRLQRNAVLIDLNATYADMAQRRIVDDAPLFAQVQPAASGPVQMEIDA